MEKKIHTEKPQSFLEQHFKILIIALIVLGFLVRFLPAMSVIDNQGNFQLKGSDSYYL